MESEIYVNSEKVGMGSYRANLDTGKYQLEARKDRHHPDSREVFLGVGDNKEIELSPEPMMGSVTVMSNPPASKGASIWVNDKKEKKTTPAVLPLLIGDYEIRVHHPDFLESAQTVSLREGQQKKLEYDLKTYQGSMLSKRNKWRTNAWLGAGLTVLSLGAGIYFNMQGDDYADDYVSAADITAVEKNYDDMDSSYQNRDLCFYVSAAPAFYWLYSWVKSGYYGSKIEKK